MNLNGIISTNRVANPNIPNVGIALNPIDKKKPIRNISLKLNKDLFISLALGCEERNIPINKAPKSPLTFTNSNNS